ncbi:MAG: NAD(P)/FAD-dependent oxidoreductase [Pirellulaceae bacterium]
MKKSVCVIGGGMMGLTVAWRMINAGYDVTVMEAAPTFGGLASAWKLGDITWDRFYHVILLSDLSLRKVLTEIGLENEIRWVETKTGFYSGGKYYSMSNSFEFLKFPPLNLIEKFRLGGTIFFGSKMKNWKRLEGIPVEAWLRKWSGNSTFEKIWRPLLKAKLGDAYQRVSASFIWSYITRMYRARNSGLKKEMFGYIPGGYAKILDTFTNQLQSKGAKLLSGTPTRDIRKSGNGVSVTAANGEKHQFDRVIVTTPSPTLARMLPELTAQEREKYEACEYLGVICSSVLLKKPLSPYYVTNITDEWVPLTGVINMSTIVDSAETGGHCLVYLPKYVLAKDDQSFEESDHEIEQRLIGVLEKLYPEFHRDQVVAFQTARARNVMALPTLNYSEKLPPAKTSIEGVYVVNSAQITKGNLNVNETIEVAEEAMTWLTTI